MNSDNMKRALNDVAASHGSNVLPVAFKAVSSNTGEAIAQNNFAYAVYRHPERYRLIPGGYEGQDIYVEYSGCRGYDKHFWVLASEVEAVKKHYTEKGD